MGDSAAHRVLPGEELPRPRALYEHSPARTRREASATTVPVPEIRRVRVGRSDVLLTRLAAGDVVAFATNCPHQGTPLEGASVFEGKLRCPRHQYLYDLHTGENIFPSRGARPDALWKLKPGYLPLHRVQEREGWVWVRERPEPPPSHYDSRLEQAPAGAPARTPLAGQPPATPAPPTTSPATLGDLAAALAPLSAAPGPEVEEAPSPSGTAPEPEMVEVCVGEEFELVLPTRFVPACIWKLDCSGEGVALLSQALEPGDEPRYRLRLAAPSPGEVILRCTYARPWGGRQEDARAFLVRVLARPARAAGSGA